MDPLQNPFSPGAGSPPPALVGRDGVLEEARVLFGRTLAGRSERSLMLTGLRGVGKTVLLNELERRAEGAGFRTIAIEAHESKPLGVLIANPLRRVLHDLDRTQAAGHHARRGLAALRNFIGGLKVTSGDLSFSLDIDPEPGLADSGDLEIDLADLFETVGHAANARGTALALFFDEVQYFSKVELSSLIMAMHRMQQRRLPVVLVGAGLPILPGLAGNSKSYAERLFSFPNIDALGAADAEAALALPARAASASFTPSALNRVAGAAQGYPYFLQEWGYRCWNESQTREIDTDVVERVSPRVVERLDESFFRVRINRLTPSEKKMLRGMADLGAGPHRLADVADRLGVNTKALSPRRRSLIDKGMVYSPGHGDLAFTVPLFDEYMRREIPVFEA